MSTQTKVEYPEHEKLRAVSEDSQVIGAFLDNGVAAQALILCEYEDMGNRIRYLPTMKRIEVILAEYFEIDLEKIGKERDVMYRRIQEMNS